MCWLKICLLFLVTTVSLNAADSALTSQDINLRQKYYEKAKYKTIASITDNPVSGSILIMLNDGTIWNCFYRTFSQKQAVLQNWFVDQEVYLWRHHENYHLWSFGNRRSSYADLIAYIEPRSIHVLPAVVGKTEEGNIVLSDGTEWKDESLLISVASYWNVGDRIFVIIKDEDYILMNMDQSPGFFYDTDYMKASLVKISQRL